MKNPSTNLFSRGSLALNKYLHNFFDEQPLQSHHTPLKKVLPVQPVAQRKLFLQLAVNDHRNIFMQLNPLTPAGQIINCRGLLSKLPNGRFLLKNNNVSYIFSFDQVRYIAG